MHSYSCRAGVIIEEMPVWAQAVHGRQADAPALMGTLLAPIRLSFSSLTTRRCAPAPSATPHHALLTRYSEGCRRTMAANRTPRTRQRMHAGS
jgi:hypothetical protein